MTEQNPYADMGAATAAILNEALGRLPESVRAKVAAACAGGTLRLALQVETDPFEITAYLVSRLDPEKVLELARWTPQVDAMVAEVFGAPPE